MAYYRYFSAVAARATAGLAENRARISQSRGIDRAQAKAGRVLVGYQYISSDELEAALAAKSADVRLGDYLIAQRQSQRDAMSMKP